MTGRDHRRELAIERMADHVLAAGLRKATLRAMAGAVGISDRMLLYYFKDKDEMLSATLDRIAFRMTAVLNEALPEGPRHSFSDLLRYSWDMLRSETLRPYMPVWLDLAAGAAHGIEPDRTIAGRIADGFLAWVTARLPPEPDSTPSAQAAHFLSLIEGAYLLEAIGRGPIAEAAIGWSDPAR